MQQLSLQNLSKAYNTTREPFREKGWDRIEGMRGVTHTLLLEKRKLWARKKREEREEGCGDGVKGDGERLRGSE